MESLLYFGYGSNLLLERLRKRCKSAEPHSLASVKGYRIEFSKVSKDSSGKATLVKDKSGFVYGMVFTIPRAELPDLDAAEGKGYGYDRIDDFAVVTEPDKNPLTVTTYIATALDASLMPYDWYLDLVLAGAQQNQLPRDHIEFLRNVTAPADPNPNRPQRLEALGVLECARF